MQNGLVQHYALVMLIGVFFLIAHRRTSGLSGARTRGARLMDFFQDHLLSIITYIAARWARSCCCCRRSAGSDDARALVRERHRRCVGFLVSLPLWFLFDRDGARLPVRRDRPPGSRASASQYHFGVDGISAAADPADDAARLHRRSCRSWTAITSACAQYYIFLLLLQTGMLGVFCALDIFLFYVFWEVMLVPMYFLIGIWGGARRLYAAIKFFLYTLVGSVLMLLGILALYFHSRKLPGLERPAPSTSTRWYTMGVCRRTCSSGCSSRSSWASRSRSRCSRSTPGCPTRTSRRRPRAR